MEIITFVDGEKALEYIEEIKTIDNLIGNARKNENREKYKARLAEISKAYDNLPKKINKNALFDIKLAFERQIANIEESIESDKELFHKDPLYFIENCGEFIVNTELVRIYKYLLNVIKEMESREDRHFLVWLSEFMNEFRLSQTEDVLRGVRNQFNSTSIGYNFVKMKKLEAQSNMLSNFNFFNNICDAVDNALNWANKNNVELKRE